MYADARLISVLCCPQKDCEIGKKIVEAAEKTARLAKRLWKSAKRL
jgi:hypothetical protein